VQASLGRQCLQSNRICITDNRRCPHLASALACRVEDLLASDSEDIVDGKLIGHLPQSDMKTSPIRVKVSTVGSKTIVRPITGLGELLSFTVPADGYIVGNVWSDLRCDGARQTLARSSGIEQAISVAGCDPAIFLAGRHATARKDQTSLVGWTMGSMAALRALQQGEVHVAGLHLLDPAKLGESTCHSSESIEKFEYEVVTFATWEEGLLVQAGIPNRSMRSTNVVDPHVTLVNREEGAGARLLLDHGCRC